MDKDRVSTRARLTGNPQQKRQRTKESRAGRGEEKRGKVAARYAKSCQKRVDNETEVQTELSIRLRLTNPGPLPLSPPSFPSLPPLFVSCSASRHFGRADMQALHLPELQSTVQYSTVLYCDWRCFPRRVDEVSDTRLALLCPLLHLPLVFSPPSIARRSNLLQSEQSDVFGNAAQGGADFAALPMRKGGQFLCCRCFRRSALSRSALLLPSQQQQQQEQQQQPPPHAHHLDSLFYALSISLTFLNPLLGSAMNDDDDDFSDGQGFAPGPDDLLRPAQSATPRLAAQRAARRAAPHSRARQQDEPGMYGVLSLCRGRRRIRSRLNGSCASR
ncbi:hypothetical protein L1887_53988 [Cichorium endivia]|nr:hypothetical protein L1887_53988 [Cichorium endivia]